MNSFSVENISAKFWVNINFTKLYFLCDCATPSTEHMNFNPHEGHIK